jgi:uncharacterized membrane protein YqjE
VLDTLRGLAQTLIGALHTRLQLISNEIEEQGARIAQMALLWAVAGFCFALAIVLGALLLVVVFWDENRVAVLAVLAALFAGGGAVAIAAARNVSTARPAALEATLAELRNDIDALRSAAQETRS